MEACLAACQQNAMKRMLAKWKLVLLLTAAGSMCIYYFSLPDQLFDEPFSTVLEDRSGQLLSASIALDGQWRFPERDSVNSKFEKAIIAFEDKRFWYHPGLDLLAMARALRQNIQAGHVVSGGSTITMQVIRLSRKNKSRDLFQKIIETLLAARAELRYSKEEILKLYAAHAPFGGNIVGIEAACWRYFGRNSQELSWGEAALLAVLPNNPSLIHLARNRDHLRTKRNQLLGTLLKSGAIDGMSYQLALSEPIPEKPKPLPRLASHLLNRAAQEGLAQRIVRSSVDRELQVRVEQVIADHASRLKANLIFNAAALIIDVKTGLALAYVGNSRAGNDHQQDVDIIRSSRSTGSILKPFLYAALLDEGKILPKTLLPDVPTLINGFAPKNFSKKYDGAVAADQALIRSLNVPAVYELKEYRYEKFYNLLQHLGMKTLSQSADHYGLTLVLGGAEGSLWDVTGMYASAARTLNNYFERPGKNKYDRNDFHSPEYLIKHSEPDQSLEPSSFLSASSLWLTFEVLKELYRPGEETGWRYFNSSQTIAWKTGTSFGLRDGWAIGVNPSFAVGVWVGNADGEGRPGLTGTEAAAPLLFDIFSLLQGLAWFQMPQSELYPISVCSLSGQRASDYCEKIDTITTSITGLSSEVCKFHQLVHLSKNGKFRVHSECESMSQLKTVSWFILPPVQEYYFKSRNLSYRPPPPYRSDCNDPLALVSMDIIYPKTNSRIFLPVQLNGQVGSTVFEATHRNSDAVVYWHLDGMFMGTTRKTHHFSFTPASGKHLITLVDDFGEIVGRSFTVISH